jgi:hypothetical protein
MAATGRVERVDTIQEQLVDQTAQSPRSTQKPPMHPNQVAQTVTHHNDQAPVVTNGRGTPSRANPGMPS